MILVLFCLLGISIWLTDKGARAETPTSEHHFTFNPSTGTITDYDRANGPKDVVIPSTIGGVPVTTIGDNAFEWDGITSVKIPDSVTTIGSNAFHANNITSVVIPGNVRSIGMYAFWYNVNLQHVTIEEGVQTIWNGAFSENSNLNSVRFPRSVTTIADDIFDWDSDVMVYGFKGTAAENFAVDGGFRFTPLYQVSFVDAYNNVLKTEIVDHGNSASPPVAPTIDYYNFTGWNPDYINVSRDLTVKAQYVPYEYDIILNSNGGSAVGPLHVGHGTIISSLPVPTREGYDFEGWYKDNGTFANKWSMEIDLVPIGGTTLYAKWDLKTYTVTFKDYDGTELKTETVGHGKSATAPPAPTREGYTFDRWDVEFTNVTSNLTVTATYKVNSYTITFNSNGGSSVQGVTVDYGSKIPHPTSPTKEGYTFGGWYKDAALTNSWDFTTDTMPLNGTTLYAKWDLKTYTVTFKDYDGTELKTETVGHGKSVTAPPAPTREGYTFDRWDVEFTNITNNLTVTATYKMNSYKITFNSNGGSIVNEVTTDYGSTIPAPDEPTREGFTFLGWNKDESLTTPWDFATEKVQNDVTLYAKWLEKNQLIDLSISAGKLNSNFSKSTLSYEATVVNEVENLTVTPFLSNDQNGTLMINNQTVKSGEASEPIPLNIGKNTITLVVTENEYSTQTYTITVTRLKSNNANLKDLQISSGALSPLFDEQITSYTAIVEPTVSEVLVTANSAQVDATIKINGVQNTDSNIALQYGANLVTIAVIAPDGTEREYELNITRLKSGNASLEVLTIDQGILIPNFTPMINQYSTRVDNTITNVTVYAQVADAASSLTLNGKTVTPVSEPVPTTPDTIVIDPMTLTTGDMIKVSLTESFSLQEGSNIIPIMVTAQDGSENMYTITITRSSRPKENEDEGDSSNGGGNEDNPSNELQDNKIDLEPNEKVIFSESGGVFEYLGVNINIPENSLSKSIKVRIEKIVGTTDISDRLLVGDIYEITKDDPSHFNRPVTITIMFDKTKYNPASHELSLYWLNEDTKKWVELDDIVVDIETGTISGTVNHFTKFAALATSKESSPMEKNKTVMDLIDIKGHWAELTIVDFVSNRIVSGYPDETFKPNHTITRAEFASILVRKLHLTDTSGKLFEDTKHHWARNAISIAYSNGVANGYNETIFGADDPITREQMAAMVVKAFQIKEMDSLKQYKDDSAISTWAKPVMKTAVAHGIIGGYQDGFIKPKENATRAEAITIIDRAAKLGFSQ